MGELHYFGESAIQRGSEHDAAEEKRPAPPAGVEPGSLSAYNQSRGRFLGVDVEVADFTAASLEARLPALTPQSGFALWIVPFRGISPANIQVPLDLVYLDKDNAVLDVVEFFPIGRVSSSSKPAASLLALPADTIASVEIHTGDQLILCGPDEMKRQLRSLSKADEGAPNQSASAPSKNWLQRLFKRGPRELRRSQREPVAGIVAYFFTGGAPTPHPIRDISTSGIYIVTEERWYLGTILRVTITDRREATTERSITVNGKVVRWGNDGAGFEFLLWDDRNRLRDQVTFDDPTGNVTRAMLRQFLDRVNTVKN